MSEEEEKGFVIKDRRRFTEEGEAKDSSEAETEIKPDEVSEEAPRTEESTEGQKAEEAPPLPEVNFSTFIFSLAISALLHLGEMPDPHTNEKATNLSLAKQTIDILGMLQEKTKGNLDSEEESLLTNLLYELRMKYVTAAGK